MPGSPHKPDVPLNGEAWDAASRRILERLALEDHAHAAADAGHKGKDLASQLKLGRLLGSRGKVEAALKLSHQLDLQHPGNPDVLCLRGDCFAALNSRAQVRIFAHAQSQRLLLASSCPLAFAVGEKAS